MKNILVALTLFASVPAFAATAAYKFTGSPLPAPVQAKLAASATRALKTQNIGALTNPTIKVQRGDTLKATLTGTEQNGSTLKLGASFAVGNTKTGRISVRGIESHPSAADGAKKAAVWSLTSTTK